MYFVLSAGLYFFIAYPILYRIERNYFNKHRKELTNLLYGYDPWGQTLSWADHLLMTGAAGTTFSICRLPRKNVQEKIANGTFKNALAPNAFRNGNHQKLRDSHQRLEKLLMTDFAAGIAFFTCLAIGLLLEKC
jgi:hypothetical protein